MTAYFSVTQGLSTVMMMSLLLPLLVTSATLPSNSGARPKFDACYGCICEAASRCNRNLGCNKGVCGLFQITQPYWEDAGAPTLPGDSPFSDGAFERCTTDTFCALETVHHYMERYGKDCNNNGQVECFDFALIHYLGPDCSGQAGREYIQAFDNCQLNVILINQTLPSS